MYHMNSYPPYLHQRQQGAMICFPQGQGAQMQGGMQGTITGENGEEMTVTCYPLYPQTGSQNGTGNGESNEETGSQGNGSGENGGMTQLPEIPSQGQSGTGNGNGMMPGFPMPGQNGGGSGSGMMPGFPQPGGNQGGMPGGGMTPGLPGMGGQSRGYLEPAPWIYQGSHHYYK
ncbi:hypothetical protein [Halobacillus faecis]|uniref:Uncharacterized protein n=1 Tax=Halobacillus faecis TaxID=360184 RepID=A0A511WNG9_9BACI|nr:hypothetical protein [Halobacillus faecis]GEN52690.1 hypothetical protein HFA01_09520 [Halobacillus faecis]